MCRGCFSTALLDHRLAADAPALFAALTPTRRQLIAAPVAGAALAAAGAPSALAADSGAAEVIFRGGRILPLPGTPAVQALAIGGGRILGLGTEAAVAGLKTKATRVVDLGGRVLMPGFIDPHNHAVLSAVILELLTDVGFDKNRTRRALLDQLRAMAAQTPPGQWVTASNFDNLLQGGELSREELDSVSTTHPIFVWYTNAHTACVNSLALQTAKIAEDIGDLPGGGHFGRDAAGRLDGMVYEESALLKLAPFVLPRVTPQLATKALGDYLRKAAAAGNTLLHDPGAFRADWIDAAVRLSPHAPCRVSAGLMYDDMAGYDKYRSLGLGARATQFGDSLFTLYGVKIVSDGSNQSRTGAQTVPYLDGTMGAPNFDGPALKRMVAAVRAAGLPVQIHANGDKTLDLALDAIEAAYGTSTALGINRIEHATIIRPDQILRMKALGVQPSFLMNHVRLYGAAYRDQIFGPARTALTDSAGACVRAGLPFTLHTDSPCSPVGSLALVGTAVTRRCDVDGSVIGPDQAVTLDQALRAVTIDAARQVGMGDRIGSLEKGKEADLVILESDPYRTAPDKLGAIKVSETWVAGTRRFAA